LARAKSDPSKVSPEKVALEDLNNDSTLVLKSKLNLIFGSEIISSVAFSEKKKCFL
jgi:hypothetical protein